MNLEQVKQKLSTSYERINNMKVAISRVESCKSLLMMRRDEVLADVKFMMNEMAQQLLNLQLCMEATVNSTVEERAKFLDAKKQDILNANSYLVEVCMEADRLLKGRNEDLLGRACQRIFTRFERAWQQLDLAGKIDARSMASLVFKSNIHKFSRSTYVAKLQQLDQYERVVDEQEFWVDDPTDSFSPHTSFNNSPSGQLSADTGNGTDICTKPSAKSKISHTLRKSPEHSRNNSSGSRCTLETIHEIPEMVASASPKREKVQVVDKKRSSQKADDQVADQRQTLKKDKSQERYKRPPVVRIREVDLIAQREHDLLEERSLENVHLEVLSSPGYSAFPTDTWEKDLIQMDNLNMRSLVSQESSDDSHMSVNHLSGLDVSSSSGTSNVPVQSELEFWKVDSCIEASNDSLSTSGHDLSLPSLVTSGTFLVSGRSPQNATDTSLVVSNIKSECEEQALPSKSPDITKEEEDFLWVSDEEEKSANCIADEASTGSALASPLDRKEDMFESEITHPPLVPIGASSDGPGLGAVVPGPTGDSQKTCSEGSKPVTESGGGKPVTECASSKNIALSTIQQHASDRAHAAGQSASLGAGDGLRSVPGCQSALPKKASTMTRHINIIMGKSLSPARSSEKLKEVVEQDVDKLPKEGTMDSRSPVSSNKGKSGHHQDQDWDESAKGWSSRTTWKTGKGSMNADTKQASKPATGQSSVEVCQVQASGKGEQAAAQLSGDPTCKSTEVQRPLKTIRTKRLDISRLLEHMGSGFFECPAKLVEQISGDLYFPIGIATNSVGDVIVGDTRNNLIKVFRNGTLITTFGDKLARPSAVIVNDKDEIFVKDDNCVMHYSREGRLLKTFGRKYMNMPYGLGMTNDGKLVVLDALWQYPQILLFGQDGTMKAFPYQPLQDAPPNSKCRFLAVYGDEVLTSDLGCSCLYLTSLTGELRKTLATKGHGPGELNEPSGITVDSAGNWIVADSRNNRIQVFAPNGYYMCRLRLSDPIRRPSGIHLSRDGLLYVINYLDAHIKVYRDLGSCLCVGVASGKGGKVFQLIVLVPKKHCST
ncbi:hypothetical protein BaRGS_00024809 [Batillaria attramentaria]|uniref:Uncharacterized protein n=1 Tax=Batillaria attramentaria TaxID=370345 RepID=A0ABD0K9X6_9CAEN